MADRYVTHTGGVTSGDGDSTETAWTLAHAATGAVDTTPRLVAGDTVHILNGTYSSSGITFSVAGTTELPIVWKGYNSSINDLDESVNEANRPTISMTGAFTVSGAHNHFRNLSITGTHTNSIVSMTADGVRFWNCDIENTDTGLSSAGVSAVGDYNGIEFVGVSFKAAGTNTGNRCLYTSASFQAIGCTFTNAYYGAWIASGGSNRGAGLYNCLFRDQANHAIYITTPARPRSVIGCTIYNAGADGVHVTTPTGNGYVTIANTLFYTVGAYGIQASGDKAYISDINNAIGDPTTAARTGVDATRIYNALAESTDPFTNAASDDYSLVTGASSKAAGFPGVFEGISTTTSYLDVGAAQRQEPAGSGSSSVLSVGRMRGGMQ